LACIAGAGWPSVAAHARLHHPTKSNAAFQQRKNRTAVAAAPWRDWFLELKIAMTFSIAI
jgi:hypothetical protein